MIKIGKYRALRNIPTGWLLQAIHSTGRSEMLFRLSVEAVLLVGLLGIVSTLFGNISSLEILLCFVIVHTLMWFLTGNFWVYVLDSFDCMVNPGLKRILWFVHLSDRMFQRFNCVQAILIYGSMCRSQFHRRSDLDLRIIRATGFRGIIALVLGFMLRAYSFFFLLPVDLQVVDSISFLRRQMRADEKPIRVFLRSGLEMETGLTFDEICQTPEIVLRCRKMDTA
jgi:predicted nucleotidyltransferase